MSHEGSIPAIPSARLGAMSRRAILASAIVGLAAMSTGCANMFMSTGKLRAESLGPEPVKLDARCATAVYTEQSDGEASFFLTDMPVEDLLAGRPAEGQVLHIELLWEPRPGQTPVDRFATNVSVRHVVVTDGQVGVYGGAGFARTGRLSRKKVRVAIQDTNFRLLESTDGFVDPLSPGRLRGTFTAVRDDLAARKLDRAISQYVTNSLGRTQYVDRAPVAHPLTTITLANR